MSYRSALILASCSVAALVAGLAIWHSSGRYSRLNALAYSSRGSADVIKGDLDRAIVDYTEAIRLYPKYAEAYYNRGTAYATKGDRESAVGDFNESNGDYAHALADYDEAIRLKAQMGRSLLRKRPRALTKFPQREPVWSGYRQLRRSNPTQPQNYTLVVARTTERLELSNFFPLAVNVFWPLPGLSSRNSG
jgi:tetratricopeptide (TPR) repeat protein